MSSVIKCVNTWENVIQPFLKMSHKCLLYFRFESCQTLGDKRSVMARLDQPLSEAELQEQEVLENIQSKYLLTCSHVAVVG